MSLRGRLVVASLAVLVCGLLAADVATYIALQRFLTVQVEDRLTDAATSVDRGGERGRGGPGGAESLRGAPTGFYVAVLDSAGRPIATSTGAPYGEVAPTPDLPDTLPAIPSGIAGSPTTTPSRSPSGGPGPGDDHDADREAYGPALYLTVPANEAGAPAFLVRISRGDGDHVVAVGIPLSEMNETLGQLLAIEIVVTVGVVVAAGLLGFWLVRVGLRPLDDIADTAAHIAAGDLTQRVKRSDDHTEIGRLGASLNVMLGQIEQAFSEREASELALRASEGRLRRFAADASHELRTPLAAIQAYAELFERGADQHPEDLPRLMHNIHKESRRMGVLVDDLLLLTRLDQGRPLETRPVDLGAIAGDAVDAARVLDPDRTIAVEIEGLVEVRGDLVRLRQIADNLLLNARIHTPGNTPIEVAVRRDGLNGRFSVVDHGAGLPDEQKDKIFERFYRADPSRSRADGGTGLGLSIVAAIAQAHDGGVEVVTTPGGGATFVVTIPLLDTDAE